MWTIQGLPHAIDDHVRQAFRDTNVVDAFSMSGWGLAVVVAGMLLVMVTVLELISGIRRGVSP